MPHGRHVQSIVKSVNTSGYDNYLHKIKRIRVNPFAYINPNTIKPTGCKSCNILVKKGETLTYDNYLNSIKSNIVKNKYTNIGVDINCECNTTTTNDGNTIYYIEGNLFLSDNQKILVENSTKNNIIPLQIMITTQ
jgi:hypothetical protein